MPLYVYEAKEEGRGCPKCNGQFEVMQHLADSPLSVCPDCGSPVHRVIQAPGLAHSKTDLHYRAKRAGFHSMKRVGRGEYEKMY